MQPLNDIHMSGYSMLYVEYFLLDVEAMRLVLKICTYQELHCKPE
jgi:hypothetical protein